MLHNAIHVRGLTKRFSGRRSFGDAVRVWRRPEAIEALRGVDLAVGAGELVGLLGPNGAGKTTLLKILATLVLPTAGTAEVLGRDVVAEAPAVRKGLGYVLSEERSFFWRLTALDNLRFFAALHGLLGRAAGARILAVAEQVGVAALLGRPFRELSTGQRQRLAIARGLLPDPPVLLFDEATRSLDPGVAERVRRFIREQLVDRDRRAVLYATHDLHEARALTDRVVVLSKGAVAVEGPYAAVAGAVEELFRAEADEEARKESGAA